MCRKRSQHEYIIYYIKRKKCIYMNIIKSLLTLLCSDLSLLGAANATPTTTAMVNIDLKLLVWDIFVKVVIFYKNKNKCQILGTSLVKKKNKIEVNIQTSTNLLLLNSKKCFRYKSHYY